MSAALADMHTPEDIPFSKAASLNVLSLTPQDIDPHTSSKAIAPNQGARIEELYKKRLDHPITQFGYDVFETSTKEATSNMLPAGKIGDDFILSHGDRIQITLSGAINTRNSYTINHEGLLLIDSFPPILAAGRPISAVRDDIETIASEHLSTDAYISLEGIRKIDILISGQVQHPGHYNLTAFHSIMDALTAAGGVQKTGSLRRISLIRGSTKTTYDLYDLLLKDSAQADMTLRDGDRIIVPTIGPTIAITGDVVRPAIYELPSKSDDDLASAMALAGGTIGGGDIRYIIRSLDTQGYDTAQTVTNDLSYRIQPSDMVIVSQATPKPRESITLAGYTRQHGLHALEQAATLSALFQDQSLILEDTYPLLGVIKRWHVDTLSNTYLTFPLKQVLDKSFDRSLIDGDKIILFSHQDIKALQERTANSAAVDSSPARVSQHSASMPQASAGINDTQITPDAFNDQAIADPLIQQILLERSLFVRGAVRKPGAYPVSDSTTLDEVIAVAGGYALEADRSAVEITSALGTHNADTTQNAGTQRQVINLYETRGSDVQLQAGDFVRVNQQFHKIADKSVTILGAVKRPGHYDLLPDDTLSKLLTRAGGLTKQAYPDGAIFSRAAERKAEERRYQSQARAIRQSIASNLQSRDDEKPALNSAQIAEARSLATELEDAHGIGRITVEADPAVLKTQPDLDPLLEAGDRIYIPRRTLTVRVSGEVLSPAALQFKDSKDPYDYIEEAGGFTYHADKERSFVLFPDGSAKPLKVSYWNYSSTFIPPGSTIIVPRDPKPFDFIGGFKDVTQILSNLAITAIFIDDLHDDD